MSGDLFQIMKEQSRWTPMPPHGLRFQLSLLTWINREHGAADPWAVARLAVPQLAELAQAGHVYAEYRLPARRRLFRRATSVCYHRRDWAELMSMSDAELEANHEFPEQIIFDRNGRQVLIAQTVFWSRVGGPEPYHDSLTLSFSAVEEMRTQVEDCILDACRSLGITEIDSGTHRP